MFNVINGERLWHRSMSFKVLLSTCTDMMILKNLMLTFMMSLNNLMMILKKPDEYYDDV